MPCRENTGENVIYTYRQRHTGGRKDIRKDKLIIWREGEIRQNKLVKWCEARHRITTTRKLKSEGGREKERNYKNNQLCGTKSSFNFMYAWPCLIDINNIDNQLDATITFINNSDQLNMFRAIISPILRSTRLCLQFVVQAPMMLPAGGRQHRGCIIQQVVNTV